MLSSLKAAFQTASGAERTTSQQLSILRIEHMYQKIKYPFPFVKNLFMVAHFLKAIVFMELSHTVYIATSYRLRVTLSSSILLFLLSL
jgi:hypothetical protein